MTSVCNSPLVMTAQTVSFRYELACKGFSVDITIFGYISVVNEHIFVKFGTLIDIGHTRVTLANVPILAKFQMAAGAILDLDFQPYLSDQ